MYSDMYRHVIDLRCHQALIRSQELEFIRMSRRDDDPPSLVSTMYRLFQEELIHRSPKDGELPIFMVSSGAAYKPPGMGSGGSGGDAEKK